jgi:hypothetical protein
MDEFSDLKHESPTREHHPQSDALGLEQPNHGGRKRWRQSAGCSKREPQHRGQGSDRLGFSECGQTREIDMRDLYDLRISGFPENLFQDLWSADLRPGRIRSQKQSFANSVNCGRETPRPDVNL